MAKKKSKRFEMADEGVLNSQFTQNGWFVKVKAAYAIDRVCFSFVMKGKKGEGFDVYVDMDIFDLWADDILNGTFARVIAAEKKAGEDYPKYYKYITGDHGQKSVGFAASSSGSGFVVNGTTTKLVDDAKSGKKKVEKVHGNVPVDLNWLRILAKYFKRTSQAHFDELARLINDAASRFHDAVGKDDEPTGSMPETVSPDEKKEEPVKTSSTQNKKPELRQSSVFVCSTPQQTERGFEAEAYARKADGSKAKTKLTLIIKPHSMGRDQYVKLCNDTGAHSDVLITFQGYADEHDKRIVYLERLTV